MAKRKKTLKYRPPTQAQIVALAKALHKPGGIRPHGGSRAYGSFGSPASVHAKQAVRGRSSFRLERQVILGHLKRGECGAAVRGLVMAGYVQGFAQAHKNSLGKRRAARGALREGNAPARHLLDLAWRITDRCKI